MEQKKENKVQFWTLPTDWQPKLSKNVRKLYGRLMCLTSAGTKECFYKNQTGAKELDVSDRTVERCFKELKELGLIETSYRPLPNTDKAIRHIKLSPDKMPPFHPTNRPTKIDGLSDSGPTLTATKFDGLSVVKSAVSLDYKHAGVDFDSLIKTNKDYLIVRAGRAFYLTPFLFSNTTQFDLRVLKQYVGGDFTPWGKQHSCVFDFTKLWDMTTYANLEECKDKDCMYWAAFNAEKEPYWREFFVMSALIELSCYREQVFRRTEECDKTGDNFFDFYFNNQIGFAFTIINAAYAVSAAGAEKGEMDGHILFKTIQDKFNLSKGHLLKFARGYVLKEALNIINDPELCQKAYIGWKDAFFQTQRHSLEPSHIRDIAPNDPDFCRGYFSLNLAKSFLCDERGLVPRMIFPTLLFRRLVLIHTATRLLEDGATDYGTERVLWLLEAQRTKPEIKDTWDELCKHLADAFPFMTKEGVFEHV